MNTSVPVVVLAPPFVGHGVARSLGRLGVAVYCAYIGARSPSAHSAYFRRRIAWDFSDGAEVEAVASLLQLGIEIAERPILIPTDDASCLFVADNAPALSQGFLFPDMPRGLARKLSSKQSMYHLCKQHDIPTPETIFPRSRDEVVAFLDTAVFPVMLKGIDTAVLRQRTGAGMVIVRDAKSLLQQYDELETPDEPNLMLQEFIPGGSEAVWMFNGYFDQDSQCLFGLTGKKIRQYPPYIGATSLGVCLTNEEVLQQTEHFMKTIGYRGILDIGYKFDSRTGLYNLLDVNPRIGTTFRLFVDSNHMDVARALYCDLTRQTVFSGTSRDGRKWILENRDLISSWTYFRDGNLSAMGWLRSFRGIEEASWFARDDLKPFINMCMRSMAAAVRSRA